ncbi:MAG: SRPBCC family protein, partial [Opitutaceae bacterium]|nr:SRPBCC family protein [Cytophagales bacterium]
AGIIVLALIIALFVSKEFNVVREVIINKPKTEVFGYIKLLKNQDNFSVWAQADPAMKKEFKGTDGNVGAVSYWDSEKKEVGKGEQEIINISEGDRIEYELRFKKPFETTNSAFMSTDEVDPSQTKVRWGFKGNMIYPMNLMLLFMDMDKIIGKDLSQGLTNLKSVLEK